jgi:thiol-disulfide isomerase/thioredoxin
METTYLLGIIVFLGLCIIFICKCNKSGFGFGAQSIDLSTSPNPSISSDSVLIFYAPWCGHCKRNMKHFKDAVADGKGKVVLIDATDDANKDIVDKYTVTMFPTIIKADGTVYSGDRSSDSIVAFSKS